MGCHSYICSECEHPIWSDSFGGEHAILMLVDEGTVLEWMQGQYNSYGRVFKTDTPSPEGGDESYDWTAMDWGDIVDLHYNGCSYSGIAAYHSKCFDGDMQNVCVSDSDPEQGWGYQEYEGAGKYRFPTEGTHSHGTTIKTQPKWEQPKRI